MPEILIPDKLDADTVVPQFVDNQYLAEDIFLDIVQNSLDYENPAIIERRKRYLQNEFIRALLYSSQVVINRIAFRNNPFFYQHFQQGSASQQAFATLMRKTATTPSVIVPYFFKEHSLTENLKFGTDAEGDLACQNLSDVLQDDYSYVRLAVDETANDTHTKNMARLFSEFFRNLEMFSDEDRNELACELFTRRPLTADQYSEFDTQLDELATYAKNNTNKIKRLSREQIYQSFFIKDSEKVNAGKFRKPGSNSTPSCLFELKKLVDLRYNATLPDLLGRYTFVPQGMPSRMALRDVGAFRQQITTDGCLNILNEARQRSARDMQRAFMAEAQKAMIVPVPGALTLSDVLEIRKWDEWAHFANSRRKIVTSAVVQGAISRVDIFADFENMTQSFYKFQRKLGDWWIERNPNAVAENKAKRMLAKVSYGLKVGPWILSFFSPELGTMAFAAKSFVEAVLPEKATSAAKNVSLNILTDFFDEQTKEMDRTISMNLELMNDSMEASREWIEETARRAKEIGHSDVAHSLDRTDQSKS